MERPKWEERKNQLMIHKHTNSSVKNGGGSVIACACMAASEMGSVIFIVDVIHDTSSMKSTETLPICREMKSSKLFRNCIIQQENDSKHTANITKDFIRGKRWKVFSLARSINLTQLSSIWSFVLSVGAVEEGKKFYLVALEVALPF